jgi:predicted secreted protein
MVANGNDIIVFVEGQAIGCLTSNTMELTTEEIETTCKDDNGNYTSQAGSQRFRITGEGNFNPASGFGFADLVEVYQTKEVVTVAQRDTSEGGTNLNISGDARLINLSWVGPLNAASTFSFEFSGQGAVTVTNT